MAAQADFKNRINALIFVQNSFGGLKFDGIDINSSLTLYNSLEKELIECLELDVRDKARKSFKEAPLYNSDGLMDVIRWQAHS